MACFHRLGILLVLFRGDWFLGGPLLSVVPLSKIASAAAGGCVSLAARDTIPFSGYFSSFSPEQLPPFPRAVLYPAAHGGLAGVDGQSSEKPDQRCKKIHGGPGGQVLSLPAPGTADWDFSQYGSPKPACLGFADS